MGEKIYATRYAGGSRRRTGTTSRQHAILLHEIADHIRSTVATDLMNEGQLRAALDSMRAWVGSNALRLLDDSRALNALIEQAGPALAAVDAARPD